MEPPEGWVGSLPSDVGHEFIMTGKWHDRFPGETRVRTIYSKFVTFYDPAVKSLTALRRGKAREFHRLQNITKADAQMKLHELEEAVARSWDESDGSGVDWESILHVVVERYGDRLEFLNHTLYGDAHSDDAYAAAFNARQQVLMMLAPHFTTANAPLNASSSSNPKAWLTPVWERCASRHTQGISTERFTPQEHLILGAVEDVMAEICRRLARMFYLSYDIQAPGASSLRGESIDAFRRSEEHLAGVIKSMKGEVEALMKWLDWVQVWSKCDPGCAIDVRFVFFFPPRNLSPFTHELLPSGDLRCLRLAIF